jgi:hypothetical protein
MLGTPSGWPFGPTRHFQLALTGSITKSRTVLNHDMTIDRILKFLMEEMDHDALDSKAKAYVDRLLLRFMTSPALMSFLEDVQILKEGNDFLVELLFRKVPQEQIDVIKKLIAEDSKAFAFEQRGQTHYGFKIKLQSDDLTGLDSKSDTQE